MPMKWIAAAVLALVAMVGLILLWPNIKEPEMSRPLEKEAAPAKSNTFQQTPPSVYQGTASLIVLPSSISTDGKGMSVNMNDLSNLNGGDEIAIFVPQEDSVHEGLITEASTTPSGNRVITGFLDGRHRFVFTVGEFQTFGTIQTETGRYQLEVRDGTGRIISVKTINEGLDFSQPDYVVPEKKIQPPEVPNKEEGV